MRKPTITVAFCFLAWAGAGDLDWKFDRLDQIGIYKTNLLGHPAPTTSGRKAIQFNGLDDAIYLPVHPLAGAEAFTWEVIFRPDVGGAAEQRFFHLQEDGSNNRMLFEIRVIGDAWCLDSFAKTGDASRTLLDRTKLHPLGEWYAVEAVYDGREFRNYVDGILQGAGELHLAPQKAGQTSIGVRFNKVNYFKGAIAEARFTRRALPPVEFLKKYARSSERQADCTRSFRRIEMRFQSLCLIAGLAAGLALAGDHPNFAGTYMLDAGNSTGAAPEWSSMTVAEKGHWFRMAQNDKNGRVVREIEGECKTDNRYHPVSGGSGGSIKCKWDGPTLTTDQHWNDDKNERSMKTTITADGKLIQDVHEVNPSGAKDAHLIWTRQ